MAEADPKEDNIDERLDAALSRIEDGRQRVARRLLWSLLGLALAGIASVGIFLSTASKLASERAQLESDLRSVVRQKADLELERSAALKEREQLGVEVESLKRRRDEYANQIATYIAAANPKGKDLELLVDRSEVEGESAPILWTRGYQAYQEGKVARAKELYLAALKRNENYAPALNSMGVLSLREHDAESAIGYFERAVAQGSDAAIANLGHAFLLANRVADAILECERASRVRPGSDGATSLSEKLSKYNLQCTRAEASNRFRRQAETEFSKGNVAPAVELFKRSCSTDATSRACARLQKLCADGVQSACR